MSHQFFSVLPPLEKVELKKLNSFGINSLTCPLCLGKEGLTYDHMFHHCEVIRIIREQVFEVFLTKYGLHHDTRNTYACFSLGAFSPTTELGLLIISIHVTVIYKIHTCLFSGQLSSMYLNSLHPACNLVKIINKIVFAMNRMSKFSASPIYKLKKDLHHIWLDGSLPATRLPSDISPAHRPPFFNGRVINLGPNSLTVLRDLVYGQQGPSN